MEELYKIFTTIALPKTNPSLVKTCFDYGLVESIIPIKSAHPLQMVSKLSNLKSTEEIYIKVRVRIYMLESKLDLELKNLPTKILN